MLNELLNYAVRNNCSDIHIRSESMPMVRIDGELMQMPYPRILGKHHVAQMIENTMNSVQRGIYEKNLELDFTLEFTNNIRFRASAFNTIHGPALALRLIPSAIPDFDSLHLPEIIKTLSQAEKGLVLLTGQTGSGKSTTLAAMIEHINQTQCRNIITIEDPVEFVHKNNKSFISQREVGSSTLSFANALRSSLREDPDVILIGEMRDLETIQLALTAAETGHLVLATLHSNSSSQAISRIIDVFPPQDKITVRSMLSESLRAVITQRLIKTNTIGRRAAFEIMIANSSIRNLIRENKVPQIQTIMEINRRSGMITLKDSILELLKEGIISQHFANDAIIANEL